jgi:gamma-glutamylcyclotransferase (GGCT)/AIG2-like uncharacterized protein YtfP
MDLSTIGERYLKYTSYQVATLENYQFRYNKLSLDEKHSYANVVERKGSKVEGILSIVNKSTLKLLDKYEGFPEHYCRKAIYVKTLDEKLVKAFVYIASQKHTGVGRFPTSAYRDKIARGRALIRKMKQI